MYLKLIETDDLAENIAESAFDVFDDADCNCVRIEPDYYHSDIDCQLDTYTEVVESELIDWLNKPEIRSQLKDNMNVSYEYVTNNNKSAYNFQFIETDLQLESDE